MDTLLSITVRMYYTGFGDCFLLTFRYAGPTAGSDPLTKTLWIDFGARQQKADRMTTIAKRLKQDLMDQNCIRDGKPYIDVFAITHEHQDHISGLEQAASELGLDADDPTASIGIGQVWFAWTEDPNDLMALAWRTHKRQSRESLAKAATQLVVETKALNEAHKQAAAGPDDEAGLQVVQHNLGVANNLSQRLALLSGFEFAAQETTTASNAELNFTLNDSYATLIKKVGSDQVRYLSPGYASTPDAVQPGDIIGADLTRHSGTTIFPGLTLFVLGPPRNLQIIRAGEPTNWQTTLRADAGVGEFGFGQSHFPEMDSGEKPDFWYYVQKAPFDEEFVLPIDLKTKELPQSAQFTGEEHPNSVSRLVTKNFEQLKETAVYKNYFDKDSWRQINTDYLSAADDLAIKLNTGVNNTSLVLAIEIDQTKEVLFFSGDAEYGVWNDWEQDRTKPAGQRQYSWALTRDGQSRTVTVEDLLTRTIFYKMGHHGSETATPLSRGINKLSNPFLHSLIPVDEQKAISFNWNRIPFKDLLLILDERKVPYIRADKSEEGIKKVGSVPRLLPSGGTVTWAKDTHGDLFVDWILTVAKP